MNKAPAITPVAPILSIEAARDLLQSRGLIQSVSPARLIASAREMQLSLNETLDLLAKMLDGGQGQGPFPETIEALKEGVK